jgi:SAM-dependent methyltransferase
MFSRRPNRTLTSGSARRKLTTGVESIAVVVPGLKAMTFHEVDESFSDLDCWLTWVVDNPWIFHEDYISRFVADIRRSGLVDPVLGSFRGGDVIVTGQNYRETIVVHGCNSRLRAMLLELLAARQIYGPSARVYAPEIITPFASRVAHLFHPGYVGSEYLPTVMDKQNYPNLRHEDIQALSFNPCSFDVYFSCEVLEHISSIPAALAEARRVLTPKGRFLMMCPFAYGQQLSITRASTSEDGTIQHVMEVEYHGNPIDGGAGSLVFTVPGWELVDQCRAAGFNRVAMKVRSSRHYGIVGAEIACVFLLEAYPI